MTRKKMQKNSRKGVINNEELLDNYIFPLLPGDRIFFYGDLGAGKSTFIRHILRNHFKNPELIVRSPTYTYFQKHSSGNHEEIPPVYHFDLYRIEDISTFHSIGATEILENPNSIALIEWPELIEDFIKPTKKVSIRILEDGARELHIENMI